jgi:hypothetical protein
MDEWREHFRDIRLFVRFVVQSDLYPIIHVNPEICEKLSCSSFNSAKDRLTVQNLALQAPVPL